MFEEFITWALEVGLDLDDDDDDDAFDQFQAEEDAFDDGFAKTEQVKRGLGENIALADANGDGALDKSEFNTLLAASGSNTTDMQAAALFVAADKNGDGELSFKEVKSSTKFRNEVQGNR